MHVFDEEKLTKYKTALNDAWKLREQNVEVMVDALQEMRDRMLRQDLMAAELVARFSAIAHPRKGATRRVWVQWEVDDRWFPNGPAGPNWFVADAGAAPGRISKPSKRILRRAVTDEAYPCAEQLATSLLAARKSREPDQTRLSSMYRLLGVEVCEAGMTAVHQSLGSEKVNRSVSRRNAGIEVVARTLKSLLGALNEIDEAINQAMIIFNEQGRRRQNVLTVRWRASKSINTVIGPQGPHFGLLRMGARSGRYVQTIQGGITRDLIRECYQGRYEKTLINQARIIEQEVVKRSALTGKLVKAQKILKSYRQQESESE